jgi:hypothetical protein
MEAGLDRPVCNRGDAGTGAPVSFGHDDFDSLAPAKGIVLGLFVSFWLWWVIWLVWRAL